MNATHVPMLCKNTNSSSSSSSLSTERSRSLELPLDETNDLPSPLVILSTCSAGAASEPSSPHIQKEDERQRRVRFNAESDSDDDAIRSTVVCQVPPISNMSPQERQDTWFQPEEYAVIKSTAKAVASSIREGHRVDKQARRATYTGVVQQVYGKYITSKEPNRGELESLNMWVSSAHSRRGLEVLSVPGIAKERDKRRRCVIEAVVREQKNVKTRGSDGDESVRTASERLTIPSKKFAYALGNADALAAGRPGISSEKYGGGRGGRNRQVNGPLRGTSGADPAGCESWWG